MAGPFQSIMSLFNPQNAAAQVQPTQTENGQQTQAPTPGAATPGTQVAPNAERAGEEVSPLDAFKEMWQSPKKEEGAPEEFNPSQIFQMDPAKMQEALGKVDFTSAIQPAQLEAIQAGGPEAMKAMMEMLNSTSRQVMSHATTVTGKMIETAMTGASSAMDKKITNVSKNQQLEAHLRESSPALTHPSTAPMAKLLQGQFSQQFPLASPAEINAKVSEYFTLVGNIAAGKDKPDQAQEASKSDTNWEQYFTQ